MLEEALYLSKNPGAVSFVHISVDGFELKFTKARATTPYRHLLSVVLLVYFALFMRPTVLERIVTCAVVH